MNPRALRTWLVCYDIADKRRLSRVHKILKREGATVQYSAFSVRASATGVDQLLTRIKAEIDQRADDVRAYHLPESCEVWMLGAQAMPEGIMIEASAATRLLLAGERDEAATLGES
jgi:CRISPR-associated protein Cas2